MDKTWLYHYDAETKQQSMEWRYSGSSRPKYSEGILLMDYLPKSQSIIPTLLVQLKDILKEKRRGNFTKVTLFLHDKSPSHRALTIQKKLAYLGFQYLDLPP